MRQAISRPMALCRLRNFRDCLHFARDGLVRNGEESQSLLHDRRQLAHPELDQLRLFRCLFRLTFEH